MQYVGSGRRRSSIMLPTCHREASTLGCAIESVDIRASHRKSRWLFLHYLLTYGSYANSNLVDGGRNSPVDDLYAVACHRDSYTLLTLFIPITTCSHASNILQHAINRCSLLRCPSWQASPTHQTSTTSNCSIHEALGFQYHRFTRRCKFVLLWSIQM